jgi:hypothetical protein
MSTKKMVLKCNTALMAGLLIVVPTVQAAKQEANVIDFTADADIGVSSYAGAPVTVSVTPTASSTGVGTGTGLSLVKKSSTPQGPAVSNYNIQGNQPGSFNAAFTSLLYTLEATNGYPIGITQYYLKWRRWTYSSEGKTWTVRLQSRVDNGAWVNRGDKSVSVSQGNRGGSGAWTWNFSASGQKIELRLLVKDNNNTTKPSLATYHAKATGHVSLPEGTMVILR